MLNKFPALFAGVSLLFSSSAFAETPPEPTSTSPANKSLETEPAASGVNAEKWDSKKRQAALRVQFYPDAIGRNRSHGATSYPIGLPLCSPSPFPSELPISSDKLPNNNT